jgi:Rps23 Pro-64 3,4-dihydroxylase Tpa1-like proline 4-hydroxylase
MVPEENEMLVESPPLVHLFILILTRKAHAADALDDVEVKKVHKKIPKILNKFAVDTLNAVRVFLNEDEDEIKTMVTFLHKETSTILATEEYALLLQGLQREYQEIIEDLIRDEEKDVQMTLYESRRVYSTDTKHPFFTRPAQKKPTDKPIYFVVKNFISGETCEQILEQSEKKGYEVSKVGSGIGQVTAHRKSQTCRLSPDTSDMVDDLYENVEAFCGYPQDCFEDLQIVHYSPGGYYKKHFDDYADSDQSDTFYPRRLYTILMALNDQDQYVGGGTLLHHDQQTIRLDRGDALIFQNLYAENLENIKDIEKIEKDKEDKEDKEDIEEYDGYNGYNNDMDDMNNNMNDRNDRNDNTCHDNKDNKEKYIYRKDPRSAHEGLPLESGDRYIATIWVRGRENCPPATKKRYLDNKRNQKKIVHLAQKTHAVTSFYSFLEPSLFQECVEYSDKQFFSKNFNWTNQEKWDHNIIVLDSAVVHIHAIPEDHSLSNKVRSVVEETLKVKTKNVMCYYWMPGSHIPWHNDGIYPGGISIYLNESWDKNHGGLFLYMDYNNYNKAVNDDKDDDDDDDDDDDHTPTIKAIVPEQNLAVYQKGGRMHATTATTSSSPVRKTLQIFLEESS